MFNRNASRYETAVGKILHRSLRWIAIYALLLGMVFMFLRLPTSFLPQEDRGMFLTSVQLPSGATQQQTLKVVQKLRTISLAMNRPTLLRFSPPWALAREAMVRTSRACLSA